MGKLFEAWGFKPLLEPLERRDVPSTASATLDEFGTIHVQGGDGPDNLAVVQQPTGRIEVLVDWQKVTEFPASAVRAAVVRGGPGDDQLLAFADGLRVVLDGQDGNDYIASWAHRSVLVGQGGNDVIFAFGGPGTKAVIIGGTGSDVMQAEEAFGGALFIDGRTVFDDSGIFLLDIFDFWADSSLSYDFRVSILRDVMAVGQVQHDGERDFMFGFRTNGQLNWYWAGPEDVLHGVSPRELIN